LQKRVIVLQRHLWCLALPECHCLFFVGLQQQGTRGQE
jgi:hypothetical protein